MTLSHSCGTAPLRAAFATLLVTLVAAGCNQSQQSEQAAAPETPAPEVNVLSVQGAPTPIVVNFPGRVVAHDTAEIRPQINGIVLKSYFKSNDVVREGDLLYEIDSSTYEAEVVKAQARLDNLTAAENRLSELIEKQAASQREYDDAVAARKEAEAELNLAKINLDHCKIVATMDGVVDGDFTSVGLGELVQIGQAKPLAVVNKLDPIKVEIHPAVKNVLQVLKAYEAEQAESNAASDGDATNATNSRQDCPAEIVLEDGSKYELPGVLNEVATKVQADVGTVAFRAEFPNPKYELLPGMFVRLDVTIGNLENGILLPPDAIFRDPKSVPYVWVVGADSKAERRDVETKHFYQGQCLIESGLKSGEDVIVQGAQYVYEGCPVVAQKVGQAISTDVQDASTATTDAKAE